MKVVIIGFGFWLGYLGCVFNEIDFFFEIVGYVDFVFVGLKGLSEEGIFVGKVYVMLQDLIVGEIFDFLMIGFFNYLYLEYICIGLEVGFIVFMEKLIVILIEESFEFVWFLNKYGYDWFLVGFVLCYLLFYCDFC